MGTPGPQGAGPVCGRAGCPAAAVVHWLRRLTAEEVAALEPAHVREDMSRMVFACPGHAITLDLATQIHAADCPGPDSAALPDCGCTPEPLPEPVMPPAVQALPSGWRLPAGP